MGKPSGTETALGMLAKVARQDRHMGRWSSSMEFVDVGRNDRIVLVESWSLAL